MGLGLFYFQRLNFPEKNTGFILLIMRMIHDTAALIHVESNLEIKKLTDLLAQCKTWWSANKNAPITLP